MKKDLVTTEIIVKENKVGILRVGNVNYISLTDLAKQANSEDPSGVIRNWMSNKNSFDYYGLWEEINNENFNSVDFHRIKIDEAPYNRFTMTPNRWKRDFNAIGIIPSSGKYSIGTFAHPDIAFEFASWLSPEFKLYLIKEFERLKANEAYQEKIDWQANRILAKLNYLVHTDAVKAYIVPTLTDTQKKHVYAEEADVLNVALFGMTAATGGAGTLIFEDCDIQNLLKKEILETIPILLHLLILNNLENTNAELIEVGVPQSERLIRLNNSARRQMKVLKNNKNIKDLELLQKQVNEDNNLITN